MKSKLVVPTLALCMGSSLLVGSIRANDHTYKDKASATASVDQKNAVNTSQLIHARVLDQTGQKIGDVEDIIMDQNSGRAQFAVIKLSGDLADNGRFTPVPFSLLKFNDTDRKDSFGHRDLTLQVDRQKLLSASRFSTKTWPDTEHMTWGPEVYTYYGVPWDTASAGATGSSFNASTSSGGNDVVVQDTYSRPRTYVYRESSVDADKPIDNGTGPDGRDTFHFLPRPWPYNEMRAGASGSAYSVTAGSSSSAVATTGSAYTTTTASGDNTRVIVEPDSQVIVRVKNPNDTTAVQNYDSTARSPSDNRVVIEDRYPSRTYRTYEYTSDKPIDNGTGPDGRDTFRFMPRPWPYHDTTDAH